MHKPDTDVDLLHDLGYEPRDVDLRAVIKWMVLLFGLMGITALVTIPIMFGLLPRHESDQISFPGRPDHVRPPEPQLQAHPARDIRLLRAEEAEKLNTYGPAAGAPGRYHIPVERAMDLLLERGVPTRPGARFVLPAAAPESGGAAAPEAGPQAPPGASSPHPGAGTQNTPGGEAGQSAPGGSPAPPAPGTAEHTR